MTDAVAVPAAASTAVSSALPTITNHPSVTVALVAGAVVNVLLAILKARYGVDFSGQEANLTLLATTAGYFIPHFEQTLEGK